MLINSIQITNKGCRAEDYTVMIFKERSSKF